MSKRPPKSTKICAVCGKTFLCFPSDKTVTCCKECSRIHRSRRHKGVSNAWSEESRRKRAEAGKTMNLEKGTPAALLSPKAGHYETNINAIDWHLIDPSGCHYHFHNLNLWAEKNYHLFGFDNPADWKKVSGGIKTAKRGAAGKIQTCTYKDWQVIIGGDSA